ncbi:MAG: NAD(P)-dependent alcohol dehydrogenase [Verrucomicrobiales bacterium]|nr:NAD(P)-dependent alcohol dehydrogenase [Verrucomicrobiales bacterium]
MKRYLLQPKADGTLTPEIETADAPQAAAGEVVVTIEATSLNYRDLLMKAGKSASSGSDPVVPLSDGAGKIAAIGEGVTGWTIGDRVALTFFRDWEDGRFEMKYHKAARGGSCDGVLGEQVVTPAHSLVRVPEYLSIEEAATLPCAAVTAWHGLMERSRPLEVGHTVLCLGTGGVSIFALQLAKAAGAKVIITSSSEDKLQRACELGADETINYRENPDWDKAVFEMTEGRGVDHVIEVGGPGTLPKSMNAVAAGGSIALIGVLTGFDAPEASLFPLVSRNVDLSGIYVGSRAMFERLNEFLTKHEIHPVIGDHFSFEEAVAAYDHLESAGHFGKVVITG